MLHIRRREGRERVEHRDRTFILVSQTWTVHLATPWFGLGWAYHRPKSVDQGPGQTKICDHLMLARITAVLLLIATAFVRRGRS